MTLPSERGANWYQETHRNWKVSIAPPEECTPQAEYERSLEEQQELREALQEHAKNPTPENAMHVAEEAVDIIMNMFGVVSATGHTVEEMLLRKYAVVRDKYEPAQNKALQERGLSWRQAMAVQKDIYVRKTANGNGKPN